MSRTLQASLIIILATSCGRAVWQSAPLTPEEGPLLGCYEVMVGPWADGGDGPTHIRVQLDSFGSPSLRRLVVLSSPRNKQPFAYWATVPPDSLTMRVGRGVEGQGLELRVRATGDSIAGVGIYHIWVDKSRAAPAKGARLECSGASSSTPQPNKRLKLAARVH